MTILESDIRKVIANLQACSNTAQREADEDPKHGAFSRGQASAYHNATVFLRQALGDYP